VLAAFTLTGLLVLVALAARSSHPGGHGRFSQRKVPEQVNNDLFTIILVLYCAGVLALIVGFIVTKSKWEPVKSNWVRNILAQVVFFSLLAVIGYHLFSSHNFRHAAQKAQQQQKGQAGKTKPVKQQTKPSDTGGASFDWTLAIGLLGLLVVGSAIYYVRARSRPMPEPLVVGDDVKTELSTAISDAIDDLEREPDARRAVIAAYARMEGVLARRGHARKPAETPFEYLSRILLSLRVRAQAVRDLTELFERAKFSTHEIDDAMKQRALSSLVSVRDDLRPEAPAT
jgi:hypothetical protein